MLFTIIIIFISLISIIYIYLTWNFNYWNKRGIIGPKPKPYFGNFPESSIQRKHLAYDIDIIYGEYKDKVPFVGIFTGRIPQILALDLEFIKDVLIRNFRKFHKNDFENVMDKEANPIRAKNPMLLNGSDWKTRRAEITPALTASKVKSMFCITENVCGKLSEYIKQQISTDLLGKKAINTKDLASRFTTDVITNCIYDIDSRIFTDEDSIIRKMGLKLMSRFKLFLFITIFSAFPLLEKLFNKQIVTKNVETFFVQLMTDAVKSRIVSQKRRDDFLNYLIKLQDKKQLSDFDVAAYSITLFLDSFETSSIVLSYTLYELAKHDGIQNKLRNEVQDMLLRDGKITFDNINELTYLDQVFYESLRINSAVFTLAKICKSPIEVDYCNRKVTIEENMLILIPIYAIHHDEEYYPNSHEFIPERFDIEHGGVKKFRDIGALLPFGDGPRICPGMRFGTIQVKAAICEILSKFKLTINEKTIEPLVVDPKEFLNNPIGGIWLNYEFL